MNEMAYVLQAWLPLIVWQQIDAPQYQKGFITVTVLSLILIITAFVVRELDCKERARSENEYVMLRAAELTDITRIDSNNGSEETDSASDEDRAVEPEINTQQTKAFAS